MRNKIGFRQYNPNKPAKYGLLFKSTNASRYPFTFRTTPYVGKPRNYNVDQKKKCKYYVSGTEKIVKTLITDLDKHTDFKGRNLSYDRLYASITLANWLLEHNITTVGTPKGNRKGVPKEVKKLVEENKTLMNFLGRNRKVDSAFLRGEYEKLWSKKRSYCMLSTLQPILGTAKGDVRLKPAIYKIYDFTKGGTDVIDQRINSYTCKAKSHRSTMAGFLYILDTCKANA